MEEYHWSREVVGGRWIFSPTPDTYVHAFYLKFRSLSPTGVSHYPVVDKTEVMII